MKRTKIQESEHRTIYQKHIRNSIGAKLVCINNRFTLPSIIFEGKDCINKFIAWVLDKQEWTQQIINEHFNKKLKMTINDEQKYPD